jgi:hypothetical protein
MEPVGLGESVQAGLLKPNEPTGGSDEIEASDVGCVRRINQGQIVPSYCWVGGWPGLFGASVSSDLTSVVLRRISR